MAMMSMMAYQLDCVDYQLDYADFQIDCVDYKLNYLDSFRLRSCWHAVLGCQTP